VEAAAGPEPARRTWTGIDTMIETQLPLEDKVLSALVHNPRLANKNLRFEAEEGRVTLRGVVRTYYEKQIAQESIRHIEGIDHIENELEVTWA
jgi:osmotically-inducible protein OsmY